MAKKKNIAAEEEVQTTASVGEPEAAEESTGASVTVTWRGRSRMYTKAEHGKDFRKLAQQFADKVNGTIE